ncbi:MAG TPA: hypothetical protein VF883_22055 [Thermoanaerobaculia bacterium]|jgi:hypothetical protein
MKTSLLLLVLLAATAAYAQEEPPVVQPDYSKESLQRFVANIPDPPPRRVRDVYFHIGAIEFRALGSRWRFNYLPFMMPLSGTQMGITQTPPDPFALTQTTIATPPRAWRTQRQVSAEMKRIEQTERAKVKVKTQ